MTAKALMANELSYFKSISFNLTSKLSSNILYKNVTQNTIIFEKSYQQNLLKAGKHSFKQNVKYLFKTIIQFCRFESSQEILQLTKSLSEFAHQICIIDFFSFYSEVRSFAFYSNDFRLLTILLT